MNTGHQQFSFLGQRLDQIQRNILSQETRPLAFEKKSAYKNGGRCSYECNYIPLAI